MFENVVLNNSEEGVFQDNYMEKRQDVFTLNGNIVDEDYDDKIEEIKKSGQKFSDYKIWLTNKQQNSEIVYAGTIDTTLLVSPDNIKVNHILSVYTGQSYINNCLVTNVNTTDKSITVKIVNTDTNPFSSSFSYSPYFKGVVLITGEASDTTTAANYKGKLDTKNYNLFLHIN